jgi:hypothetical protein
MLSPLPLIQFQVSPRQTLTNVPAAPCGALLAAAREGASCRVRKIGKDSFLHSSLLQSRNVKKWEQGGGITCQDTAFPYERKKVLRSTFGGTSFAS